MQQRKRKMACSGEEAPPEDEGYEPGTPQNASAEYVGDMFEFWLGMLELGVQFPTMLV